MAKGLLLKGDKDLELVLLCSNKPTVTLLTQVAEKLNVQLEVKMNSCNFLHIYILYKGIFHRFGIR